MQAQVLLQVQAQAQVLEKEKGVRDAQNIRATKSSRSRSRTWHYLLHHTVTVTFLIVIALASSITHGRTFRNRERSRVRAAANSVPTKPEGIKIRRSATYSPGMQYRVLASEYPLCDRPTNDERCEPSRRAFYQWRYILIHEEMIERRHDHRWCRYRGRGGSGQHGKGCCGE